MKMNNTMLEFSQVFESLTHAETWHFIIGLRDIKDELESCKEDLMSIPFNPTTIAEQIEQIADVDTQLDLLNINIKTVETALLAHESKYFEKRSGFEASTGLTGLHVFCLN